MLLWQRLQWLSSFVHIVLALSTLRGEMPRPKLRGLDLISELRHLKERTSHGFKKHLKRVKRRVVGRDEVKSYRKKGIEYTYYVYVAYIIECAKLRWF